MNAFKKTISLILIFVMVMTTMVTPAFADYSHNGVEVGTSTYWYTFEQERYKGASYDASFEDMAGKRLQVYGLVSHVNSGDTMSTSEAVKLVSDVTGMSNSFSDVPDSTPAKAAIDWAMSAGIITGIGNNWFSPDSTCTRGEVVTFLWRAAGRPEPNSYENIFADVESSDWYYVPVLWATEAGITNGTNYNRFSPNKTCSNAEVITFLYRTFGILSSDSEYADDTEEYDWFYTPITWAASQNILSSSNRGTDPNAGCTRSSVATFIYNAEKNEAVSETMMLSAIGNARGWHYASTDELSDVAARDGITYRDNDGVYTAGDVYQLVTELIDAHYADHITVKQAEITTPTKLSFTATSVAEANAKLEKAMNYAPKYVAITLENDRDKTSFYSYYKNWKIKSNPIDALVGAVWTRTDSPFAISSNGNIVTITIDHYSDGWLSYVDTSDYLRVFADIGYSKKLADFRKRYIDTITGDTEHDKAKAIVATLFNLAEYDHQDIVKLNSSGGKKMNPSSHSVRGLIDNNSMVCDGYVASFQFAAACLGIKSFDVIGQENKNIAHSINKAFIDGNWMNIDISKEELYMEKHSDESLPEICYFGIPENDIYMPVYHSWIRDIYKASATGKWY